MPVFKITLQKDPIVMLLHRNKTVFYLFLNMPFVLSDLRTRFSELFPLEA